jgi:hypothetical protein
MRAGFLLGALSAGTVMLISTTPAHALEARKDKGSRSEPCRSVARRILTASGLFWHDV